MQQMKMRNEKIQQPHADFSSFQVELESSSESVDGPRVEVMMEVYEEEQHKQKISDFCED